MNAADQALFDDRPTIENTCPRWLKQYNETPEATFARR